MVNLFHLVQVRNNSADHLGIIYAVKNVLKNVDSKNLLPPCILLSLP